MPAEVADILLEIVASRRRRLAAATDEIEAPRKSDVPNPFVEALRRPGRRIIAEVKMGSPRLGSLVGRVDPERQAVLYAEHGAAALSVVVEPDHFFGSYDLLERCRRASGLPAIAKDFIVDARQIAWARAAGADAVLLIAALYSRQELERYGKAADDVGLACLVETHGPGDLAKLGNRDWPLVGVNNRDLRTFEVDLVHSREMVRRLPPRAVKVSESGLDSADDLARLEVAGFDAFLIGESLLLAPDPAGKLQHLLGRVR